MSAVLRIFMGFASYLFRLDLKAPRIVCGEFHASQGVAFPSFAGCKMLSGPRMVVN
jgi:hypothetical protein